MENSLPARSYGFKPGVSGNPKGRKPGRTPQTLLRKSLVEHIPKILAKLVELAEAGDVGAAKVLLDKCLPNLRPQAAPVELVKGVDLAESGANIVAATLNGSISADTGVLLSKVLSDQAKLVEQSDLMERIAALEEQLRPKLRSA
jgi:hypothetical protein